MKNTPDNSPSIMIDSSVFNEMEEGNSSFFIFAIREEGMIENVLLFFTSGDSTNCGYLSRGYDKNWQCDTSIFGCTLSEENSKKISHVTYEVNGKMFFTKTVEEVNSTIVE